MSANPAKFAELLVRGVNQIHAREGTPKLVVRDELGYAVGKQGRTALDYWCRDGGHIPDSLVVVGLAREIVSRKGFSQAEAEQFLINGGCSDGQGLEFFPSEGKESTGSNATSFDAEKTRTLAETIEQGHSAATANVQSVAPLPAPNTLIGWLSWEISKMRGSNRRRVVPPVLIAPMVLGVLALFGLLWVPNLVRGSAVDPSIIPGGFVKLVGDEGARVVISTARGPIGMGKSVAVNEPVTVRFKILDNDTRAFSIQTLVIGARGPGVHCSDPNAIKWSAPNQPFPTASNIHMEPGKEYEYVSTRSFYEPGTYILEPNVRDNVGRWGGIQPFTCIDLVVGE